MGAFKPWHRKLSSNASTSLAAADDSLPWTQGKPPDHVTSGMLKSPAMRMPVIRLSSSVVERADMQLMMSMSVATLLMLLFGGGR